MDDMSTGSLVVDHCQAVPLNSVDWVTPNPAIVFCDQTSSEPIVELRFSPPSVTLREGITWDEAAKTFWNAVARVQGLPEPFKSC